MKSIQKHPLPYRPPSFRSYRIHLYLGIGTLIFIVVLSAALALHHLRRQAEMRAFATTQNLAESLNLTFTGMVNTIDIALLNVKDDVEDVMADGNMSTSKFSELLHLQEKRLANSVEIRATDEYGNIVYGQHDLTDIINAADRDRFIYHRDNPDGGLFISGPILSRITHEWVWLFARRLDKPGGKFAGIVYAVLPVQEIGKMFSQIQMHPGSTVGFRSGDLKLIFRYVAPGTMHYPDSDMGLLPELGKALEKSPVSGTYFIEDSPIDGVSRLLSYYRSPKYHFLINVGMPNDVAFAEWYRQVWIVAGLVMVFVAASLVFARMLVSTEQRNRLIMQTLQESESSLLKSQHSLQEAQKLAQLGQYSYDLATGQWTSSPILDGIFGIDDQYTRDVEGWLNLFLPECRHEIRECLASTALYSSIRQFDNEYRIIRHCDGQERWVHGNGVLHVDENGSPQALVGTIQDITDRKKAELEILSSRARLAEMSTQLIHAQEQERRNLAHELHDELGQRFTALNMNLHQIAKHLSSDDAIDVCQKASEEVSSLIQHIRNLSVSLLPPTLIQLGLEASLEQLLAQHFSSADIDYVFDYVGLPEKLPPSIEITIYRVVQEAITNVARHANARHVSIEVNGGDDGREVEILVRDDGNGFDTAFMEKKSPTSLGLVGMRERVRLLGGNLKICSTEGEGTVIHALLPLKIHDDEENSLIGG